MKLRSGARIALGAAGAAGAVLLGFAGAVIFITPPAPEALTDPDKVAQAPVVYTEYDDPRAIDIRIVSGSDIPLTVQAAGRVTANSCDPTIGLSSGSSTLAVDGIPLLNLATGLPLWRDLRTGDHGQDVIALQTELVRLGQAVVVDGRFGRATVGALNNLFRAVGASTAVDGTALMSRIIWLPTSAASVTECVAAVGSFVSPGDTVATARSAGTAAIVSLPEQLVEGERVVVVDGTVVPVDASGSVATSADVDALRETPSFRTAAEAVTGGTVVVAGSLRLEEAESVAGVPPSAVLTTSSGVSCVFSAPRSTSAFVVHVVGSVLGQSLIVFEDNTPPTNVAIKPDGVECG